MKPRTIIGISRKDGGTACVIRYRIGGELVDSEVSTDLADVFRRYRRAQLVVLKRNAWAPRQAAFLVARQSIVYGVATGMAALMRIPVHIVHAAHLSRDAPESDLLVGEVMVRHYNEMSAGGVEAVRLAVYGKKEVMGIRRTVPSDE